MTHCLIVMMISFAITSSLFSQSDSTRHKDIAEFCILRNTLTNRSLNVALSPHWARSVVGNTKKILESEDYKYKIEQLGRYKHIEIISIVDHTNIQLHGLHFDVVAVFDNSINLLYQSLYFENLVSFVNDYLIKGDETITQIREIIELHAAIFVYFKTRYHGITQLLSREQVNQFWKRENIDRYHEDYSYRETTVHKVFKHIHSGKTFPGKEIDYIEITYWIKNGKISITEKLLSRQQIPDDLSETSKVQDE